MAGGAWTWTLRDEANRVSSEFGGVPGVPMRDNVYLGNLLVASLSAGGSGSGPVWSFYSSDHLGTPRLITDLSGAAVETRKSWPYGEDTGSQSFFQRVRFASMERDVEGAFVGTGGSRYYDHARTHEFNLGRFLSVDRSGGDTLDPQSLNGYTYALNNPLKYNDPNGRIPALAVAVALGAGVVEGGFRAADFALSRSNATTGDYIREFGIGFVSGVSAATVGILTALGTANPFIIGAAAGETDALVTQIAEIATDQRSSLDPVDVALKTGTAAVLGKTTDVLVPRLPGRVPHYFRNRSFGDLFARPNVNRELRQGLAGAFLGTRGFKAVDILREAGGLSGVYGPGYLNFQLFLYQFNTEVAGSRSTAGGSVTTCSSFSLSPGGTSPCPR